MVKLAAAVANELAAGVDDVLNAAAAVVTGAQPEYIATGEPGSVYGKLQLEGARQACRRYADDPAVYQGRASVLAEKACRPYLDSIGYGQPPTIGIPFSGGQCPVTYRIDYQYNNVSPGGVTLVPPVLRFANVLGPLSDFRGEGSPAFQSIRVTNGAGVRVTLRSGSCPQGCYRNVALVSITRVDGLPDVCGSPTPDITPPVPPPVPGPPFERFNPSPGIDVDIGVEINPDGTISIDFGAGPDVIDPFGDDPPPGGGGGAGAPPPGDVGQPGATEGTGEGGDAEGEAPVGSVLVGLKIEFAEAPQGGNQYRPGVYRGVCYVYMGTDEGLDHDPAGAMLQDGQFVYAEKDNLTKWRVSANRGYNLRITPYYREVGTEED